MAGPRYRAVGSDMLIVEPLDLFTAVFHRPSGLTHLLTEPAPQILDLLANGGAMTADALLRALSRHYELGDAEGDGAAMLHARLMELEAAGLIEAA
ncbi:HPr-rel-A system PqqD family peptide chaperone [Sphingomonas sp. Leaf21]|uniref:HPr-rel-A system PqqD family peptide chaperone n=1 Tax=Sphingomonas sp. Leaf21 TaxID=2876550 RepID=UPI001E4BB0ED|nr:HPr-rel-A system PqqD family peptide chaperone [Sphingomonas sp. Leaf21]